METTGVEPVVPEGRRIYSPLGLPIFLHLQICNTLRYAFRQRQGLNEECVLKHSKLLSLTVRKECFNTL